MLTYALAIAIGYAFIGSWLDGKRAKPRQEKSSDRPVSTQREAKRDGDEKQEQARHC